VQELRFARLYRERAGVLAEVRAGRGRQVLDANDPSAVASTVNARIRVLEDELGALAEAASEARRQRRQTIPKVFAAEAAEAEREATELDRQADALSLESQILRKALEAHDGCSYSPTPPPMRDLGGPRVEGGGARITYISVPKFEVLRMTATGKRAEAVQHRQRKPHRAGSLNAENLESLLAAVYSDPMRIGPPVDTITAWAEQAIEKERRRHALAEGAGNLVPSRLYLEWTNGEINAGSFLVSSGASEVGEVAFDSSEVERFKEPAEASA
jgi:hypothetical protein